MAYLGSLYSDAALREYAEWVGGRGGVLKFSYDASIAGSKLQDYPISPGPRKFVLGQEPVAPLPSFLLGLLIGYIGKDYLERKGRVTSVVGGLKPSAPTRWW